MQTLKSSGEIKDFIVDNIIFNLPKVNVTSVTLLKSNVNLNVKAQSENITLNENFNSFIKTVKNTDTNDVDVSFLTEFFFYYQKLLKILKIPFPISS